MNTKYADTESKTVVGNSRRACSQFWRSVGKLGAAAGVLLVAAHAHATNCEDGGSCSCAPITFDDYGALSALPNKAKDSFTLSPFYGQWCKAGNNASPGVHLTPDVNSTQHYHLSPDDPAYTCVTSAGGLGKLIGGQCVGPADYGTVGRFLETHYATDTMQITATNGDGVGEEFDLDSFTVHAGSPNVYVRADGNGTAFQWTLGPGTWNLGGQPNLWRVAFTAATAGAPISVDGFGVTPSFSTHVFENQEARGYQADGDWKLGQYKGECEYMRALTGISTHASAPYVAHALRCQNKITGLGLSSGTTLDFTSSSNQAGAIAGDWDFGFNKGECANNQVVVGVSQVSSYVHTVRCASAGAAAAAIASSCEVRTIQSTNDLGSTRDYLDWSPGYLKAECADGKIVKGVSTNANNGGVHRILCCGYSNVNYTG